MRPVCKSTLAVRTTVTKGKAGRAWHREAAANVLGAINVLLPNSETCLRKAVSTVFTEKVGGRKGLERLGVCENRFPERCDAPNSSVCAPRCAKLEKGDPGLKTQSH